MSFVEILLVQDAEGDFRLLCEGFRQFAPTCRLIPARSASEARRLLRTVEADSSSSHLRLVMIGSPYRSESGEGLLQWLKTNEVLHHLPVVMLIGADEQADVNAAYGVGANCVVKKSGDLEVFFQSIQRTLEHWLEIARLPPANRVPQPELSSPLRWSAQRSAE